MSVAEHQGLDNPSSELIHRVSRRCPGWCTSDPRLAVVTDPLDVRRWTLTADRDHADDVLRALATLTAPDGGNDRAAQIVLCWTTHPTAAKPAHQLRGLTLHIDDTARRAPRFSPSTQARIGSQGSFSGRAPRVSVQPRESRWTSPNHPAGRRPS